MADIQLATKIDLDKKADKTYVNGELTKKVDNSRVLTDVPANAKFTDTTYSEITESEIDSGSSSTLRAVTGRRIKYTLDKVQSWISGLTKSDIGLSNVDNTSDLDKPISTATQTALNSKVDNSRVLTDVPLNAKFTDTITSINGKTGAITKADIVALGIPAQDTVYTHPENHPATMITGLHTIATSGSYNDLSDKPDIPAQLTKLSELTNDCGFIDGAYDNSVSGLTATTIQAAIDELKVLIDGLASSGE